MASASADSTDNLLTDKPIKLIIFMIKKIGTRKIRGYQTLMRVIV